MLLGTSGLSMESFLQSLRVENPDLQKQICEKYQLRECKVIRVKGLHTAFVCAGLKSILVLPAEKEIEDIIGIPAEDAPSSRSRQKPRALSML